MELDIMQQAAQEAAQSSLDAHGEYVDALTAWDFIAQLWYHEKPAQYDTLVDAITEPIDGKYFPIQMPAAFADAYAEEVAQ
jgi:hypothetical protein